MKDIKSQSGQGSCDQNRNSEPIGVDSTFATVITTRSFKSLQSKNGKISGSTTMRSGTITRTNKSIAANIHSFNFTGMNGSSMVSPGSGRSPSVDSFISNLNTHGVFGIDTFNPLPAHSDLIEWISDANALIKEFDLWSMQNHIDKRCRKTTPDGINEAIIPTATKETLNNQYHNDKVEGQRGKNATARAKEFNVIHGAILSQKSEATHV